MFYVIESPSFGILARKDTIKKSLVQFIPLKSCKIWHLEDVVCGKIYHIFAELVINSVRNL